MLSTKRIVAFSLSTVGVLLCSLVLFVIVIATQGVVIYNAKYYESTGPFSYGIHDWIGDMPTFFMFASPLIFGTAAAVFGLYWWLNRCDAQTRTWAVFYAARAALVSLLFILVAISIGEVVVYKEANGKIIRLNKYGPPGLPKTAE